MASTMLVLAESVGSKQKNVAAFKFERLRGGEGLETLQ